MEPGAGVGTLWCPFWQLKDEDIVMWLLSRTLTGRNAGKNRSPWAMRETEKGTDPIYRLCRRQFFKQSDAFLKHVNNPEDYCLILH